MRLPAGRRGRFTTLAGLATELQEANSRRELARVVGRYTRTELVILDKLGYLGAARGRRRARLPSHLRAQRTRLADPHHQPAVQRLDQGVPRPAAGQGRRRPDHAQSPHHRHRHRELALSPRPRAPRTQTSMTPRPAAAHAAIAAQSSPLLARPSRRQPRPRWGQIKPSRWGHFNPSHGATSSRRTAADRAISHHQPHTPTDGGWVHFNPSRWGQCKSSFPDDDQARLETHPDSTTRHQVVQFSTGVGGPVFSRRRHSVAASARAQHSSAGLIDSCLLANPL
jgi:hypothetical protein